MELRYDLMKMADLDRFRKLLSHYKKIPEAGLTFGVTDNARETYMDHDDEECWEEMALLFVTKTLADVEKAEEVFLEWAATQHPDIACNCVTLYALDETASRFWLYILR